MKILAIGTSNNRNSINRTLAHYAASLVDGAEVEVLDIHDYEMPLFSDERERHFGQPLQARKFFEKIGAADALVIAFAEHNGSYTAAYKNLFDWASRIDGKVFQNKPVVYLSTSPGPGGARSVLAAALESAPFFGAEVVDSLSVPKFHEVFDVKQGLMQDEITAKRLRLVMAKLAERLREDGWAELAAHTSGYPFK